MSSKLQEFCIDADGCGMTDIAVGHDPVVEALTTVGAALARDDLSAACAAMGTIAVSAANPVPRRPLPIPVIARIFRRDHFVCRYCEKQTVPTAVLRAISSIPALRDIFPYHPAKRTDSTHPAYRSHAATCDHIVSIARGGSRDDPDNLATSCWDCNRTKADQMLEQTHLDLSPIRDHGSWDGLTNSYRAIWRAGGSQDRSFHMKWLKAFGL